MNNDVTKRSALLVASLASFLMPFMGSSLNVALPSIGMEFAIDAVLLTWVSMAYLLAAAVFLVPFGRLADISGRKKIFRYGISIYTIASLLSAFSIYAPMLIGFRVMQGFGAAMMIGTGVAILTSVYPPGERGKALGINVAALYMGLSVGPFVGGLITQHLGWRWIFVMNVPLGIIMFVFISFFLKGEWAEAKGEKFDVAGSVIYGLALVLLMLGLSQLPAVSGAYLILAGLAGFIGFIKWETRMKYPVLELSLFGKNRTFAFSNVAALINYGATATVGFLLSLYLQFVRGFNPQTAGLVLISQPIVQAAFSPIAGRLSDRIEPRVVASLGMGLTAAGLFTFTFLEPGTSLTFIIGILFLIGFGFALFSSPNTNAVMSSVGKHYYGVASGTLGTMRLIGNVLSMGIAMLLLSLYMGRVEITSENALLFLGSAKAAFAVFSALCFAGIFASLARGKVRQDYAQISGENRK